MQTPNHEPEKVMPPQEWFGDSRSVNYTDAAADDEIEIYHSKPLPPAEPDPNEVEPPF